MPFPRPTLTELRAQVAADINAGLKTVDGLLRFSNLGVLGTAAAGLAHLHYAYLDWIAKQAVPYTATDEYLEAWAALKAVYRKPATYGQLSVTWAGTVGRVLPAGTEVARSDGVYYMTMADATVNAAGLVTATVQAKDAGTAGNAEVGSLMTLGSAVDGVQSAGAVVAIVTTGADQELDDDLRTRMLAKYQSTARGGADSDYIEWALEVAGVTRAWVNPRGFGAGTVVVYVMLDSANAAANGFPSGSDGIATLDNRANHANSATGDQLTVANAIYATQPVTPMVYVCSPIASPVNFTISGLTASTVLKAAIAQAIAQVFLDEGEPLAGSQVNLSSIEAAIAAITGSSGFVISTPDGNLANQVGYLPTLGAVSYV
ncbi:baseplate J/gp47 family protein [Pseudomonas putida]|nr:baseplate J/gp47 family protein [Pseudomonas putida]MBI6960361.1 baseplate J/gp47 family protein [Pseudomonas putida]